MASTTDIITAEPLLAASQRTGILEIPLELEHPQQRFYVRSSSRGTLGRAEAAFEDRSWAAKHYWQEGPLGEQVTVFEFDEPLPPGHVMLRVPFSAH